jgi:protease-4
MTSHPDAPDGVAPPRVIAWEVTRSCNLACVHCRASAIHGPYEGELSTGEAFKLVDEIGGEEQAVDWLRKTRNVDKSLKVVNWKPEASSSYGLFSQISGLAGRIFGASWLGQVLSRDPSLSTLGLDGLVSVWHPAEN